VSGVIGVAMRDDGAARRSTAVLDIEAGRSFALLTRGDAVVAAVLNASGEVLLASPAFDRMIGPGGLDTELAGRAQRTGSTLVGLAVDQAAANDGPGLLLAYAPARLTNEWLLPADIRAAAATSAAAVVALGMAPPSYRTGLAEACAAHGMAPLESRVVLALIETGSTRKAAVRCGVTYNTAREAVSAAQGRLGLDRASSMVEMLTLMSFGVSPGRTDSAEVLADIFGLSVRQLALACCIADGMERRDAARAIGVSDAVAKKELDRVYAGVGVSSATALARVVADARSLAMLTDATNGAVGWQDHFAEPLSIFTRPDGRRIAMSDYGPALGRPVLVLHSSMTNRPVATVLVQALQRAGFRPLSMDRPGYGLTDEAPGHGPSLGDPFDLAADDLVWLCGELGLEKVDLVARGAAQVVIAVQRRAADLLDRVVLVNPDPVARAGDDLRVGPTGAVKESFRRRPWMIATIAKFQSTLCTPERSRWAMFQSIKGSAPDERAMADPRNMHDYYRSVRMFATGRMAGFINEQTAMNTVHHPDPIAGTHRWTVLIGAQDFLHAPAFTRAFWSRVLPDAGFETIEGAGRLLAISHPEMVVGSLVAARN
jgi:hypothetical protein